MSFCPGLSVFFEPPFSLGFCRTAAICSEVSFRSGLHRGLHLESCTPGTRQYKVVRTGTYQYILFWIQGGTRKGKIVHTSTDESVLTYDISMAVHTGMYWYVLYGTRRYKEVQPSTKRYTVVQGTVQGGTRQYVLVCTGMY